MARTKSGEKIEAQIVVGGVALREWEDEDDAGGEGEVVRYVEAVSGVDFAVRCTYTQKPQHDILAEIYLDNIYTTGHYAKRDRFRNGVLEKTTDGALSNKHGRWMRSNFAFSDLKTGTYVSKRNGLQDLSNTNCSRFNRSHSGRSDNERSERRRPDHCEVSPRHQHQNLRSEGCCHRNDWTGGCSRKGSEGQIIVSSVHVSMLISAADSYSHDNSLRDPVPIKATSFAVSDYIDPSKKPFMVVTFKYRSRSMPPLGPIDRMLRLTTCRSASIASHHPTQSQPRTSGRARCRHALATGDAPSPTPATRTPGSRSPRQA
jgi:hypothetical protein